MPTTSLFSAAFRVSSGNREPESSAVCEKVSNQAGSLLSYRLPFNVSPFFVSCKFLLAGKVIGAKSLRKMWGKQT